MQSNAPASAVERFAALVEPHYEVLYRAAYRLTRSTHDAEDLAQEVCVRAYPRLAELETLEQPRAWLLRVMYRLFVDWTRRYERTHVESMETVDLSALESDEAGPAELAELLLDGRHLDSAWRKLDSEQRGLLALHDVEGYTLAELGGITGLKEGTLKSRLHRARVRLGKLLRREQEESAARKRAGAQG
ncbi:MAG TPA: RNA polymerase sigma factor [Gammaproteobacteria bacterium]|nr:RNA polymerase sigma factor [Gammaproteobacteria bacterium]